jgi:hypothetical protein
MKQRDWRSGQAMLTAVLSISGAILGATTVAGFLMLYQLRASTDSENSAKAIFAADSGVEWTLFDYYCGQTNPPRCSLGTGEDYQSSSFSNGVSFQVTCSDVNDKSSACNDASNTVSAVSLGLSSNSRRAFALMFTTSTNQ